MRPDHDDPAAIVGRHGPRQPHTDAAVAAVRRLIEQSTLNYRQIAARTGVSTGSISNWARDGGWKRPPFAPRACDTIPTPRATAKLKRRMLGARLDALAERHVRELEESACVDPVKLGEAMELLKMARLAARGAGRDGGRARLRRRRRRGRSRSSAWAAWTSPAPRARRSRTSSPTASRRQKTPGGGGAAAVDRGASASMRG